MISLPAPESATLLPFGVRTPAKFEDMYAVDWYRLEISAGTTVIVQLLDSLKGGGSFNILGTMASLTVVDAGGQVIAENLSGPRGGLAVSWTAPTSATYYLLANHGGGVGGTYTMEATLAPADAIPASSATTAVLDPGSAIAGSFDTAGDSDWYRFAVEAGQHYSFGSSLDGASAYIDAITLRDASGALLANVGYPFEPAFTGHIYVSVDGYQAGTYRLVSKVLQDDYSANLSAPGQLAAGAVLQGEIQYAYDVDRFSFAVEAGHYYTLRLTPGSDDLGRLSAQLRNHQDIAFGSNVGSGQPGAVEVGFVAHATGTYHIEINHDGMRNGGKTYSPYSIGLVHGGKDDYTDHAASAAAITVGQTLEGSIQVPLDVDRFVAQVVAGTTYRLELVRPPAAGSPTTVLEAKIPGEANPLLLSHPNGGGAQHFTPRAGGAMPVTVAAQYDALTVQVPYAINLTAVEDDFGANPERAGALALGDGVVGKLEYSEDRDWFGIDLQGNQTYWFECGIPASYGYGTKMRLIDGSGKILDSQWSFNTTFSFKAPETGRYYVEVFGIAAPYSVTARIGVADDYGHTAATAGTLAMGATVRGNIETNADADAFNIVVESGATYAVTFKRDSGSLQGVHDPIWEMKLAHSAGDLLYANPLIQPNDEMLVVFTARTAGTVTLNVSNGNGIAGGAYSLRLEHGEANDLPDDRTTTAALAAGQSLSSQLALPGDTDAVRVRLEAGQTYAFDLLGAARGGGTLALSQYGMPGLSMRDPAGSSLYVAFDRTHDASWRWTAQTTGEYLVVIGDGSKTGSYTLRMLQVSGDAAAPQLLSSPGANVGLRDNLVLGFSEPMLFKSGKPVLTAVDSGLGIGLNNAAADGNLLWRDNALVLNPDSLLQPGTRYQLELPATLTDYAGNAYAGPVRFEFDTVPLASAPSAGNDWFSSRGIGQKLEGGAGLDTVAYSMPASAVSIARLGETFSVKLNGLASGDTLAGIERLMFNDVNVALDIKGIGGQAYRLYQAAFDRAPDQAGLGFWIGAMDRGASLGDVAAAFIGSNEFQRLVGATATHDQFVDALYRNVLDRAADSGGGAYWRQALAGGASRADVLAAFSESPENQDNVVAVIGNGFAYLPG
jgi:hypothetical protein